MENDEEKSREEIELAHYRNIVENLETIVKDDSFKSKEELNEYLNNLQKHPIASTLISNEEILRLLNLYDEYHKDLPVSLDMQNYSDAKLGDNHYIVANQDNAVLKNSNPNTDITEEFKQKQNEITSASTKDELANADIVFDQMKNTEKEELNFIPINEAIGMSNIDTEVLNKIKFFITNKDVNPYDYHVNPNSGILYHTKTDELYEVRKNEETGKYEIFKGGEKQYTESDPDLEDNQELIHDKDEEKLEYENAKVKRLIKPPDNAAFVNNTFIVFIITTISILVSLIIALFLLTNK